MTTAPRLHVRMSARRDDEEHRTATPFELLFDLVFVVAVASLVGQAAHATVSGAGSTGTISCSTWRPTAIRPPGQGQPDRH